MERRHSLRVSVDWDLTLRQDRAVSRGRVVEFSEYGLLAHPSEIGKLGERYQLSFTVPTYPQQFEVRGVVVYLTAKGVGIRFESVAPEVTSAFRRCVKAISNS